MPLPSLAGLTQKSVVGIADLAVSTNPNVELATYSLGSCLGVSLYDPVSKVGGLLHIMLPDSSIDPVKAALQPAMFADTGLPAMLHAAHKLKADKKRVQICVAGGAQILDTSGIFNIGRKNYESLACVLQQHGLSVQAEHVGGLVSRSMYLNIATGEVRLKISGQPNERILWTS
ncbi:MAG: chemotaxis protein CheD [Verrucomicrobia bacterium]|nr:chemotaxis protein CheD [Verrucomicrobiota bacterium]